LPLPLLVYWLMPAMQKRRVGLIASFFDRAAGISHQQPKKRAWSNYDNKPPSGSSNFDYGVTFSISYQF
jgi:hypothetical protein